MILEPKELWKQVSAQTEVSTFGRKRVRGKIVELTIGPRGYYTKSPHRLVAKAFIANPDNLPEVHHIDGNPLNNNINNLMWVTFKENSNDPIALERMAKAKSKPIRVWNEFGYSQTFQSVKMAQKILGIGHLSQIARGILPHTKGYQAEYI